MRRCACFWIIWTVSYEFRVTAFQATFTPDGWPIPASLLWEGETLPCLKLAAAEAARRDSHPGAGS